MGNDHSPPEGQARKKRWAPKVRTGCHTCRIRRVKCDETQPVCIKCARRGAACLYTLRWQPPEGEANCADAVCTNQLAPIVQTDPPEWPYMQSVNYYFAVVKPMRNADLGPYEEPVRDPPFLMPAAMIPNRFVCQVLIHKLGNVFKQRGQVVRRGQDPACEVLWANYAKHLAEHIGFTNHSLRGGKFRGKNRSFHCLNSLMFFDLATNDNLWQKHINGALAYAQSLGGVRAALASGEPTIFFRCIIYTAIRSNAFSPASRQIVGISRYTDDELMFVLDHDDVNTPVPVALLMCMVHITNLRIQVATRSIPSKTLRERMAEILGRIDRFDPDAWSGEVGLYEKNVTAALGRIFQLAVRLYGILSLPRSVITDALGAAPGTCGASAYHSFRIAQREKLMSLIRQYSSVMHIWEDLPWACIVTGVALADGGAIEDRQLVLDLLYRKWQLPMSHTNAYIAREKLCEFWQSGNTEWEQCFYEPVPG